MKRRDFNKLLLSTSAVAAASPYFSNVALAADSIDSPYLFKPPFAPTTKEFQPTDVNVLEGRIPSDITGTYFRNGPNQVFVPEDPYHWFDGDGMIHAMSFEKGAAKYFNRQIQTKKLKKETEAGKSLYSGFKARPAKQNIQDHLVGLPIYPDTSNTDLVFYNKKLYSLRAPIGEMYEVDTKTLETKSTFDFNGQLKKFIAAHSKLDPNTGEFVFFGFDLLPNQNGESFIYNGTSTKNQKELQISSYQINGSKNMHDFAITKNYSILLDQPLLVTQQGLKYRDDLPSRFGFSTRGNNDIFWIETPADYIIHTGNAFETSDNKIVLRGCEVTNLGSPRPFGTFKLDTHYSEWIFCLKTKILISKKILIKESVDFPVINETKLTKRNRYSYLGRIQKDSNTYEIDSLIKYDHKKQSKKIFTFESHIKGNEFSFIPKENPRSEDDGYLVGFVQNIDNQSSELYILNAKNMNLCARLSTPNTVPAGFHGIWVSEQEQA